MKVREICKVTIDEEKVKDYNLKVKNHYEMLSWETKSRIIAATESFEKSLKELLYNNKVTDIYDVKFKIEVIPLIKE